MSDGVNLVPKGLIVADEPGMQNFAAAVLEDDGYVVLSAKDAASALRIARLAPWEFDFLVTGYDPGTIGGLEFAAAVREISSSIRILVMSGGDINHLVSTGLIDSFLLKPFSALALRAKVTDLLKMPVASRAAGKQTLDN